LNISQADEQMNAGGLTLASNASFFDNVATLVVLGLPIVACYLSTVIAVRYCRTPFGAFMAAWLCTPMAGFAMGFMIELVYGMHMGTPDPNVHWKLTLSEVLACFGVVCGPIPGLIAVGIISRRDVKSDQPQ
jgi:hypothetical protein